MTYFTDCQTVEELKKEYRRLAMLHHPDRGGNAETMKEINNAYDDAFNHLKDKHNARAASDSSARPMHETPEEFREVISRIINIPGLVIELCGAWVWVSGNTKAHKDELKSAGYRWANKKAMWYWRSEKDACKSRGGKSMNYIRGKYGSERIGTDQEKLSA